jgi:hypothetical protein
MATKLKIEKRADEILKESSPLKLHHPMTISSTFSSY